MRNSIFYIYHCIVCRKSTDDLEEPVSPKFCVEESNSLHTGFLLGLFLDFENGGDTFHKNTALNCIIRVSNKTNIYPSMSKYYQHSQKRNNILQRDRLYSEWQNNCSSVYLFCKSYLMMSSILTLHSISAYTKENFLTMGYLEQEY